MRGEEKDEKEEEKCPEKYKTMILSGGGVKGFCTLGALQYLYDNNLLASDIGRFVGTSVGSMICYFIAIGYTPVELMVCLCSNNVFESLTLNPIDVILTEGFYNYDTIDKHCRKMTIDKIKYVPTLSELKKNFNKELIVCTYNFTDKKKEYMSYLNYPDLSCLEAIRMSSNLPFIFNSYFYMDKEYIDGGFADNFPLIFFENRTIGIYLKNKHKDEVKEENKAVKIVKGIIDKFYNLASIPLHEIYKTKLEEYKDYPTIDILEIEIENVKLYNFSLTHAEKLELFSLGYNKAKEFFEQKQEKDEKEQTLEEEEVKEDEKEEVKEYEVDEKEEVVDEKEEVKEYKVDEKEEDIKEDEEEGGEENKKELKFEKID